VGAASAAALIALAAAGSAARAEAQPSQPDGATLAPDLRPLPASSVSLSGRNGNRRLRFATEVLNRGPGPLEVATSPGDDCDGDNNATNDRLATQRLFSDRNGDGVYGASGDGDFESSRRAGCVVFHPHHRHWHLDRFARYELRHKQTGARVARNGKVSFCLSDGLHRRPALGGSPPARVYPPRPHGCGRDSVQGISVGWADYYGPELADQALDASALREGRYCLIVTVDPANLLLERNERNNVTGLAFRLRGERVDPVGLCGGSSRSARRT
jgi:hypothetical protein